MSTGINLFTRSAIGIATVALFVGQILGQASTPTTTPASAPASPSSQPAEAQTSVKLSRPGTFEIHFRESGLREAFEILGSQSQKNIITTKEVTGKVSADLYEVTFKEALDAILSATGYVCTEEGNFIYVMTPEQRQKKLDAERKIVVRSFHLAYITASDARTLIAPALSKDGTIATTPNSMVGISSSKTDGGGNAYATEDVLIVRDFEENISKIEELIRILDAKPQQVLIEATVLRATLNETNALGIDFNTLAGVNFETLTSTTAGNTQVSTGTVDVNGGLTPSGTFRTDFNGSVPNGGVSFGFISDNIAVFLRALESITDTTVLANPKLLVINKQRGEVMVGNRDGYLTTTITETVATQTVQFLETGTRLIVRPFIGRDGYVRMEIHPEDSSGSVGTVGTSVLPSESTTEVTSNVIIRDGHTIVIGGLFRERTVNSRSQVPALGNIPLLGAAFRTTNDAVVREEVIILITPHIVQQEAAEAIGEQTKDDVERFRIGTRKGLQWFGRSKLSQTYVRWAKAALEEGDEDRALCNLDMALSMQPRLLEAIRLKERLTNKAYWANEAQESSIRFMVQEMIMHDMGKPPSMVIPPNKPLDNKCLPQDVRERFGMQERLELPLPLNSLVGDHSRIIQLKQEVNVTDSNKAAPSVTPVNAGATTQPAKNIDTKVVADSN